MNEGSSEFLEKVVVPNFARVCVFILIVISAVCASRLIRIWLVSISELKYPRLAAVLDRLRLSVLYSSVLSISPCCIGELVSNCVNLGSFLPGPSSVILS